MAISDTKKVAAAEAVTSTEGRKSRKGEKRIMKPQYLVFQILNADGTPLLGDYKISDDAEVVSDPAVIRQARKVPGNQVILIKEGSN